MTQTTSVLWTVDRANRALPLVRRIVADLVATHARWRDLVERFTIASAMSSTKLSPEAERLQRDTERAATEIDGFVRELAELGVECKSLESGLVDFPAERDGRVVYLCWRDGEAAVTHWHEVDAGFSGRQPL
jgi:hypothetical protein